MDIREQGLPLQLSDEKTLLVTTTFFSAIIWSVSRCLSHQPAPQRSDLLSSECFFLKMLTAQTFSPSKPQIMGPGDSNVSKNVTRQESNFSR